MRKVLFGTPAHDGRVEAAYCLALVETVKLAQQVGVQLIPIIVAYDSLVQRARNDLVKIALESGCDDLVFMDSDQEWAPQWIFQLLNHSVDIVGCPVPKKLDVPLFNVKALPDGITMGEDGLMEVACVGTGFMRISRKALQAVWDVSVPYRNEGKEGRWVFDVQIVDGELVSEDNVLCNKWREQGGKVWLDPAMTCNHIGVKKYSGNFMAFLDAIKEQEEQRKAA